MSVSAQLDITETERKSKAAPKLTFKKQKKYIFITRRVVIEKIMIQATRTRIFCLQIVKFFANDDKNHTVFGTERFLEFL
jgi:hypothetical protein